MNHNPPTEGKEKRDAESTHLRHQYASRLDYINISLALLASKLFDLRIQVQSHHIAEPTVPFKTQTWDLSSIFMSPLLKWEEIIESFQAAGQSEFPQGVTRIDELSPNTASIIVGAFSHLLTIITVRKAA